MYVYTKTDSWLTQKRSIFFRCVCVGVATVLVSVGNIKGGIIYLQNLNSNTFMNDKDT